MIVKTEAIILRKIRHEESNLIVRCLTQEQGIQSFLVKGYGSSRSKKKGYYQPLSIVEFIYQEKATREIHPISETNLVAMLHTIQTHPIKLSLGLTIAELVYDCVKGAEQDLRLYDLIKRSILEIDSSEDRLIHLFIYFLVQFSRELGFSPRDKTEGKASPVRFFPKEGSFASIEHQVHHDAASILREFLSCDWSNCQEIHFDNRQKREMIGLIFEHYRHHIEGFDYPQSMRVFAEVFS